MQKFCSILLLSLIFVSISHAEEVAIVVNGQVYITKAAQDPQGMWRVFVQEQAMETGNKVAASSRESVCNQLFT